MRAGVGRLPLRALVQVGLVAAVGIGCAGDDRALILATTTSVQDSGLLDALLPRFSDETGIAVQAIAVGTGAALRMGREGNADALLTHAPEAEQALVDAGIAVTRTPLMENHFVIAGPPEDPARVAEAASAEEALRSIHRSGTPFASRGDDSGTHGRERALWRAAGIDPERDHEAYLSTGTGMGLTLQVAGERRAYLLTDLGTFLAYRERTGLVALSRRDAQLRNEYALLRVSPDRYPGRIRADLALALEQFLVRPDVQRLIGEFGRERFGQPLFHPLAAQDPAR